LIQENTYNACFFAISIGEILKKHEVFITGYRAVYIYIGRSIQKNKNKPWPLKIEPKILGGKNVERFIMLKK